MLRLLPFIVVTLAASPALAGATAWQELVPGVKARLISSDVISNGTILAGLELDMPATTRTYWRIPGESGIPTTFDFSGSTGIADTAVLWPYPSIEMNQGYRDYVYAGSVVLPLEVKVTGAGSLTAAVTLGVCSDVCIPARARFTLPVSADKPDPVQSLRINQAVANVPIPWDRPAQPFADAMVSADGSALLVSTSDPGIDAASLIADVGDPSILFATPQKSPDGAVWTLKLLGGATLKGLEGRPVQLTFLTAQGPYSATLPILAAR